MLCFALEYCSSGSSKIMTRLCHFYSSSSSSSKSRDDYMISCFSSDESASNQGKIKFHLFLSFK